MDAANSSDDAASSVATSRSTRLRCATRLPTKPVTAASTTPSAAAVYAHASCTELAQYSRWSDA
jgi:hypothetical protein